MRKLFLLIIVSYCLTSCQNEAKKNADSKSEIENASVENIPDVAVALKFINGYVENCNKMNKATEIVDWVNSNSLTTEKFKKELKQIIDKAYEADPELGLDFDPIFDAQDYPDEGLELESVDNATGFLIVAGKKMKQFRLTMKLVNVNNKWLVDGSGIVNVPKEKQIER